MDRHVLASPIVLAGLTLENRLVSAPMAGVSDRPFRRLVREAGAALVFPEMVSDKALLMGNRKTRDLAAPYPGEKPFPVQLLGRDPQTLADAALKAVECFGVDLVDINMGCPVPKVVSNGEGAALLKEPTLCGRIIERVRRAVPVPVTCKMRLGWDRPRGTELARVAADAGAAFITFHARLRTDSYAVPARWTALAEIVQAVSVPIVGNGDVLEPEDALRMLDETGCAAVMVARGCRGNPWIFSRALRLARRGDPGPPPSARERISAALRHLEMLAADKGERRAVLEMRGHGSWYIKGLPGAAAARARLMKARTVEEMRWTLTFYLDTLEGRRGDAPAAEDLAPAGEGDGPECPTSRG